MHHHSESPEVIHAKLAEWERTVATHRAQREAERGRDSARLSSSHQSARSMVARLRELLAPARRMDEQSGA